MDIFEKRVGGWLDLRTAPSSVVSDDVRRETYRSDIIEIVRKHAPPTGQDQWLGEVLERVLLKQKTGVWPNPEIWSICCGAAARPKPDVPQFVISRSETEYRIFCDEISAGIPVSEHKLFGVMASKALREGGVSLEKLREYQRAAYMKRKSVYKQEEALRWLEEKAPAFAREIAEEIAQKKAKAGK